MALRTVRVPLTGEQTYTAACMVFDGGHLYGLKKYGVPYTEALMTVGYALFRQVALKDNLLLLPDYRRYELLGRGTSNQAEWEACFRGVRKALQFGVRDLTVVGDSQLIIRQLTGKYRCRARNLQPRYRQTLELLKLFRSVCFVWKPRDFWMCQEADELANEAKKAFKKEKCA